MALSTILDQIVEAKRVDEDRTLIAQRFPETTYDRSALQLSEAMRIVQSSEDSSPKNLQEIIDGLCALSMHDGLTGAFNRRYFDDQLEVELRRTKRALLPLCVIMGDIDHFKGLNDRYGHLAGDLVLQGVAKAFANSVRATDSVSRYGGEEFAAILPNTSSLGAMMVAWRIRAAVAEANTMFEQHRLAVTISLGVAAFAPADVENAPALVKRADEQLYRAKAQGRNQVCCAAEDLERMKPTGVSNEERGLLLR